MKPRAFALTITLVTALLASPTASAQATMKIAHAVPPADPRGTAALYVAEKMNASTICAVDAKVFPSGQLGTTTDLIEGMQIGAIEAVIMPASFLVGFEPLMGIFDFPYFWPQDRDTLLALHVSDPVQRLLDETLDEDIVSLAVWHTGYKVWTSKTALRNVSDFRGIRSRTMPSKVQVRAQRLLGLTPVNMPFAETYSALQTGAISAQENPITTNFVMRFHEVQTYSTFDNHGTLDQLFMVARPWFEGLSDACRAEIREAVEGGRQVVADETVRMIELALPAFAKGGMEIINLTEAEAAALRDATLPGVKEIYIEMTGEAGRRTVEAIEAEIPQ